MKYWELEDDIVARLTASLSSVADIVALPDNQDANRRPTVKPRVTVSYFHSMFGEGRYGDRLPTLSTDGAVQEENIQFKVTIESKKRRGEGGLLELLTAVRQSVTGYEPRGLDKIKILEQKFEDFAENLWSYSVLFATKGIVIEEGTIENLPNLNTVDFDELFPVSI